MSTNLNMVEKKQPHLLHTQFDCSAFRYNQKGNNIDRNIFRELSFICPLLHMFLSNYKGLDRPTRRESVLSLPEVISQYFQAHADNLCGTEATMSEHSQCSGYVIFQEIITQFLLEIWHRVVISFV